jgi:ligand-binding SRPBCC domain-containing protein
MPILTLHTHISAPVNRCFDLARSIDLHQLSTQHTGERVIAGRTVGLIELGETVTWRAKHFGIWQSLTSKITEMDAPNCFVDEMVKGAFKRFRHEHRFDNKNGQTVMTDVFDYTSPLGMLGVIADILFLKQYMTRLLIQRNQIIKEFAESDRWLEVI